MEHTQDFYGEFLSYYGIEMLPVWTAPPSIPPRPGMPPLRLPLMRSTGVNRKKTNPKPTQTNCLVSTVWSEWTGCVSEGRPVPAMLRGCVCKFEGPWIQSCRYTEGRRVSMSNDRCLRWFLMHDVWDQRTQLSFPYGRTPCPVSLRLDENPICPLAL